MAFWQRKGKKADAVPDASAAAVDSQAQSELASQWETDRKNCETIKAACKDTLTWTWDGRFNSHQSVVTADQFETVLGIVQNSLTKKWDESSIQKAPPSIQNAAEAVTGLRADQYIFTADTESAAIFYCVWWPWGDGSQATMRLCYHVDSVPESVSGNVRSMFQSWF